MGRCAGVLDGLQSGGGVGEGCVGRTDRLLLPKAIQARRPTIDRTVIAMLIGLVELRSSWRTLAFTVELVREH